MKKWKRFLCACLILFALSLVTMATAPFQIRFDACGGLCNITDKYCTDDRFGALPTATRDGYVFDGWFTGKKAGVRVYPDTPVREEQTLYAHWAECENPFGLYRVRKTCTLAVGETVCLWEALVDEPGALIRAETEETACVRIEADGTVTALAEGSEDVTVTASYKGLRLSVVCRVQVEQTMPMHVTLYPTGGVCAFPEKTVYYGAHYGFLPTPKRAGFSFEGWYTHPTGGERVNADTTIEREQAHGLYARWTAFERVDEAVYARKELKLDIGERVSVGEWLYGTTPLGFESDAPAIASVTPNGDVTAKASGKAAIRFSKEGETTASGELSVGVSDTKAHTTVYLEAGEQTPEAFSFTRIYDEVYGALAAPTELGRSFVAWVDASTDGSLVLPSDTVRDVREQALYAVQMNVKFTDVDDARRAATAFVSYWGLMNAVKETEFGVGRIPTLAEAREAFDRLVDLVQARPQAKNAHFADKETYTALADGLFTDTTKCLTLADAYRLALATLGKTAKSDAECTETAEQLGFAIHETKYAPEDAFVKEELAVLMCELLNSVPSVKEPLLTGDLNDDGKVNVRDNMILARYLAGWEGYDKEAYLIEAADCNADGRINVKDNMILARHLAGWEGYETLPKKD